MVFGLGGQRVEFNKNYGMFNPKGKYTVPWNGIT
jgi:hypothetical protein